MDKGKIALTGGTGFIGSVIALKLGKENCVLFTRATSKLPAELEGYETKVVDLNNKEEVVQACKGTGGIIHFAASLDVTDTLEKRKEVEINGALSNFLDAAAAHNIPLVYASSIAARWSSRAEVINHLPTPNPDFSDYSPYYALGSYSRSKQLGEELILERVKENESLRACSILPSAVYGRSPLVGFWNGCIAKWVKAGKTEPPFFAPMMNPLVSVDDVAEVTVKALEKGEKRGEAYPCYGGNLESPKIDDWMKALGKEWGFEYTESFPADYEDEGKWPSYTKNWKYDNALTEKELGVKFRSIKDVEGDFKKFLEEKELK